MEETIQQYENRLEREENDAMGYEHECPFEVEMNGNTDFRCNCSSYEERQCALSI